MIANDCEPNSAQRAGFSNHTDHAAWLRDNSFTGFSPKDGDIGMIGGAGILGQIAPGCPDWPSSFRDEGNGR